VKRLAINLHEPKRSSDRRRKNREDEKIRKRENAVRDEDAEHRNQHDQKLSDRNRTEDLILLVDELRDNEFLWHTL
jgi:hypothetical protein